MKILEDRIMNKAFTLAEVLITLGVIGIIAAMTLPAITQKVDKQVTVAKLKKSYSTLQQVVRMSEKDHGKVTEWDFPVGTDYAANESEFFKEYFEPYFKVVGRAGSYSPERVSYMVYNIDGDNAINVLYWHILPDGTAIAMFYNNSAGGYIWIFIDISAKKGPNRLGKDVFMTELYRNKRLEMVWSYLAKNREQMLNDSLYPCKKGTHKQYAGGLCGTLIELDCWEIKDDYPW